MDSFEELGLAPELVEALAAEGIEEPTPLQEDAVPVLRRGNNLILAAGPGSGTMVAWGTALLDRISEEGDAPAALVLTPTPAVAGSLAQSLGRLAAATGHAVAALEGPWALPARARIVLGTPEATLTAARAGSLDLSGVEAVVFDQAEKLAALELLPAVEEVLGFVPKEGQRVVCALPLTDAVQEFSERHVRRATVIPPRNADGSAGDDSPHRGEVRYRVVAEPREDGVLSVVADLLEDGARHVLVFCRSEDRAADVGDYLTLHGYLAGAPGDATVPVWLGVDALEARRACEGVEDLAVVSSDVPNGPDEMDRRHGIASPGVAVVLPREVAHLRDVARRTGYTLQPMPQAETRLGGLDSLRAMVEGAMEEQDVEAYLLVLEPLFAKYDPALVAAAATALLRRKHPAGPVADANAPSEAAVRQAPSWVKIFLSVGHRDGLSPGDLVGAITGEARVPGEAVGKIDIKESHSLVDVEAGVAPKVIKALNGTSIRGRAVRADVDRPRRPAPRGGRTPNRRP